MNQDNAPMWDPMDEGSRSDGSEPGHSAMLDAYADFTGLSLHCNADNFYGFTTLRRAP